MANLNGFMVEQLKSTQIHNPNNKAIKVHVVMPCHTTWCQSLISSAEYFENPKTKWQPSSQLYWILVPFTGTVSDQ